MCNCHEQTIFAQCQISSFEIQEYQFSHEVPTYDMVLTSLISTSLAYIYIGFVGK